MLPPCPVRALQSFYAGSRGICTVTPEWVLPSRVDLPKLFQAVPVAGAVRDLATGALLSSGSLWK